MATKDASAPIIEDFLFHDYGEKNIPNFHPKFGTEMRVIQVKVYHVNFSKY